MHTAPVRLACIGHACMHTAPVRLGHRRHSGGKSSDGEALALARGAGNRAAGATQFSHRRAGWWATCVVRTAAPWAAWPRATGDPFVSRSN